MEGGGDGGPGGGSSCGGGGGGGGPTFTRLFSRNEDVDRLNLQELSKLHGECFALVLFSLCFV